VNSALTVNARLASTSRARHAGIKSVPRKSTSVDPPGSGNSPPSSSAPKRHPNTGMSFAGSAQAASARLVLPRTLIHLRRSLILPLFALRRMRIGRNKAARHYSAQKIVPANKTGVSNKELFIRIFITRSKSPFREPNRDSLNVTAPFRPSIQHIT